MNTFNTAQQALTGALSGFGTAAQELQTAVKTIADLKIPEKITIELAPTTVGLSGETSLAAALANAIGGKLGQLIAHAVRDVVPGTNSDGTPAKPAT